MLKSLYSRASALKFFVFVCICLIQIQSCTKKPQEEITEEKPALPKMELKVLLVDEDLVHNSQRFHDEFHYQDPQKLLTQIKAALEVSSQGYLNINFVETISENKSFARFDNNFETPSQIHNRIVSANGNFSKYIPAWQKNENTPPDYVVNEYDYKAMFEYYNVCDKVNSGQINEVWIYSSPLSGGAESIFLGPKEKIFWLNSTPIEMPECQKPVAVMFINYQREYDLFLHSFGHRIESLLVHMSGYWPQVAQTNAPLNLLEKFFNRDITSPDKTTIGNIHSPFNSSAYPSDPNLSLDYDYANHRSLKTNYKMWEKNLLDSTDESINASCSLWGCTQEGYMLFWFHHLPRYNCKASATFKHNEVPYQSEMSMNWWSYIIDYESAVSQTATLSSCDITHLPRGKFYSDITKFSQEIQALTGRGRWACADDVGGTIADGCWK